MVQVLLKYLRFWAVSVALPWSVQRAFALFYLTISDMVFKWLTLILKVGIFQWEKSNYAAGCREEDMKWDEIDLKYTEMRLLPLPN